MTIFAIILLILLGLLLLLIEFVIIPGVTIAGIGGFLLLGTSVSHPSFCIGCSTSFDICSVQIENGQKDGAGFAD